MTKLKYKITVSGKNGETIREEVGGYRAFEMFGFNFGVHNNGHNWAVTELSTGLSVMPDFMGTRKDTVKMAEERLQKVGQKTTDQAVTGALSRLKVLVS